MTVPMMGRVRIRPGWGAGQRSMSLQAVDRSHIQQSANGGDRKVPPIQRLEFTAFFISIYLQGAVIQRTFILF